VVGVAGKALDEKEPVEGSAFGASGFLIVKLRCSRDPERVRKQESEGRKSTQQSSIGKKRSSLLSHSLGRRPIDETYNKLLQETGSRPHYPLCKGKKGKLKSKKKTKTPDDKNPHSQRFCCWVRPHLLDNMLVNTSRRNVPKQRGGEILEVREAGKENHK